MGQGQLSWDDLSEVLLDVEIVLNNRPPKLNRRRHTATHADAERHVVHQVQHFATTAIVSSDRKGPQETSEIPSKE